ncbi:UNVERIFIED_CONTAM: Xaa-Pro aminopeptidase [Brevibacillus sp. OAP136]
MTKANILIQDELDVATSEMELAFPILEYKNRLNKIRKAMAEQNIDLLYITNPENLYYVSGYSAAWYRGNPPTAWSESAASGIAIHVDHDKFILFDVVDELGITMWSTVSTDSRIYHDSPHGKYLGKHFEAVADGMSFIDMIVRDLKNEGWTGGRTAIEMGSYRPVRPISEKLQATLEAANCEVVDGTKIVRDVRFIKSPMELRYIETASKIADIGMQAALNVMKPGITELDIVAEYTYAMHKAGGENMAIVGLVHAGPERVWCRHPNASRRLIMPGDPIEVDLSGVYYRYHSNLSRCFSIGEPDPKFAATYAQSKKSMMKVKEIIKPNMYVNDFMSQMNAFYKEEGMEPPLWFGGYEVGISYPPDWVGEFVYDTSTDHEGVQFAPGAVVNFETGFGINDTLIFTKDEAKILGTTPWDLLIV